jgi:hypothetical protein
MGLRDAFKAAMAAPGNLRADLDNADSFGHMPIPGSAQFTLEQGEVKIWYQESAMRDTEYRVRPKDLDVVIRSVHGGVALPIVGPGVKGKGAKRGHRSGATRDLHGSAEIPAADVYEVSVTATLREKAVEPQLLLGK